MELTNTEYERLALANRVNLSDGHAKQPLTVAQRAIINRSLAIFDEVTRTPQEELERAFLDAFFGCADQPVAARAANRTFLNYSSSAAIKIAAQYCRITGRPVNLIEPCFDNIRHMLATEGVAVRSLAEPLIADTSRLVSAAAPGSAIWVVLPNNPTGFTLTREQFAELARIASQQDCLLIIDHCFRFFAPQLAHWDQYEVLEHYGCQYISIEDTGKTWGLSEMKIGITVSSGDARNMLHRLHDELLLNVSGFHLAVLTAFIEDSRRNGLQSTVRALVDDNRREAHRLIGSGLFSHASEYCHNVPMEFLRLPAGLSSVSFWSRLRGYGVDILPASNYYWTDAWSGRDCLRIPLTRDPEILRAAVPRLQQALEQEYSQYRSDQPPGEQCGHS